MSISVRTRFEIFKRDNFTCRYCGKKSPEVILQLDHIIPVAGGGTNDDMNLVTSCFECNSGKSDKPLSEITTGENPYDKAVELLERERQLKEYYVVQEQVRQRLEADHMWLVKQTNFRFARASWDQFIRRALEDFSRYEILKALDRTWNKVGYEEDDGQKYFCGIIRNWREERKATERRPIECWVCSKAMTPSDAYISVCSEPCLDNMITRFKALFKPKHDGASKDPPGDEGNQPK